MKNLKRSPATSTTLTRLSSQSQLNSNLYRNETPAACLCEVSHLERRPVDATGHTPELPSRGTRVAGRVPVRCIV